MDFFPLPHRRARRHRDRCRALLPHRLNKTGDSNALANIVVNSVTAIVSGLWLVFLLPALLLVVRNTRLDLALGLALAVIPAALIVTLL